MNILATVFLLIVASLVSQAAVTITITPATSGTNFSVTQTSSITLIDLSPYHISGISIAPNRFKCAVTLLPEIVPVDLDADLHGLSENQNRQRL